MEQMMQVLRDPIWQFVGAFLGAIGLVVSLVALRENRRKPRKELSLYLTANTSLLETDPQVREKTRVFHGKTEVHNLRLYQFILANTGTIPIGPSDYIEPIRIHLAPSASIIEMAILREKPPNLGSSMVMFSDSTIELGQTLLNPGDYAEGKILAFNSDRTVQAEARILGIPSIKVITLEGPPTVLSMSPRIGFGIAAVLSTVLATLLLRLIFSVNAFIGWLMAINLVTYAFFAVDKVQAVRTLRPRSIRIPEIILLMLSALGGSIGALTAVYFLRHKAKKEVFVLMLWFIVVLQLIIIVISAF